MYLVTYYVFLKTSQSHSTHKTKLLSCALAREPFSPQGSDIDYPVTFLF